MIRRILHCGKNYENYKICIDKKVFGFINNSPKENEIVYLALKIGKISYCGARAILSEVTDYKPWIDSDSYAKSFTIKELEFCEPFDLKILADIGGKYWSLKYLQGAKSITDSNAIKVLENNFKIVNEDKLLTSFNFDESIDDFSEDEYSVEDAKQIIQEIPDSKIDIMGTFQIVNFKNETDPIRGLEAIVTENFFSLFPSYPSERTLLIPEHRMFKTKGFKSYNNRNISGIRGIPDGLLITFNPDLKNPIQIGLIEYECFGELKTRSTDKSNYLNSQIIPQLMRFASSFSVVTDKQTREETIQSWTDKIIEYIYSHKKSQKKLNNWISILHEDISEQLIALKIKVALTVAFRTSVKVILIIDDLSSDQKETIKNVINSFKLENGESVQFTGYVVRLTQKISLINNESEYALSIQ